MANVLESPPAAHNIVEIDVGEEMEASFLEYAYSVIYARALPDARDGLKPVQRRILYMMSDMGLLPDRAHVKSARVVGEVMGKLHPHGDMAIYDALVRLAQDFSLRLPLVDGHGNFGSLDDGPAAPRYTEARMATSAVAMTNGLGENVVDFTPTYDNKGQQPAVLPSAIPNLLVNGATGIAVGMATNMAPHNLHEVIAAAQHLLANPNSTLAEIMEFIPGPDLPSGGRIVGLDGVREAYATGRGIFRTRATTRIENISAKRKGIIVTELPYLVGPEKIMDKVGEGVKNKKIQGVNAIQDLTDRKNGLRIVIEVKSGFDPEAVLEQLFRTTPLEESFGINNVALVDGQPQTLSLLDLLRVWVNHRVEVVQRRTEYRLARRLERLHLVEGLLLAIADIDEVIQIIRSSDDAAVARNRLMDIFDLSEAQANYILDLQLRRLTKFSRIELEAEQNTLEDQIAQLREILDNREVLHRVVSDEMGEVAATFGTPRRTVLIDQAGQTATSAAPATLFGDGGGASAGGASAGRAGGRRGQAPITLEIADTPTEVVFSATGLLARVPAKAAAGVPAAEPNATGETASVTEPLPTAAPVENTAPAQTGAPERPAAVTGATARPTAATASSTQRGTHDAIRSTVTTTTRSEVGVVTSLGRLVKVSVLDLPALPQAHGALSLAGGVAAAELLELPAGEQAIGVVSLAADAPTLALGTLYGTVKRVIAGDQPNNKEEWEVIALKDGDKVIGCAEVTDEDELVFIASDSSLLHFSAKLVRPQGRAAGGMAGINLAPGQEALFFGAAPAWQRPDLLVVTVAGSTNALFGATSVKVTPYEYYPAKGRATGGVRSQRFLKGEDRLVLAWMGPAPARAVAASGKPVTLPAVDPRRDGSGSPLKDQIAAIG